MQRESIQDIYTVSHLNTAVRTLLENHLTTVWVEGEISNFAAPNSGHWYFSLKDTSAQVKCAMFRGNQRRLVCCPKDGMHVLIKARVSLYENRGEYQLIVENIEERGEGKLRLAFEALKKKLDGLGWFDPMRKKPLPLFPHSIGIITSSTGAAIRDILHVLNRRYPCANVIIYPTLVQGETAAPLIAKAIQIANQRKECDVLIIARGGGSLEDLWPFNEEIVASAIFQSLLPIISGVGHETDFTIADFVSDRRAPTPSAAAEIATPDKTELLAALLRHEKQIIRKVHHLLTLLQQKLGWINKNLNLKDPKRLLRDKMQHLDFCESTLIKLQRLRVQSLIPVLSDLETSLYTHCENIIYKKQTLLQLAANQLNTLSPLATLDRGYAIVTDRKNKILKEDNIKTKDKINIRLKNIFLHCAIEKVEKI